MSFDIKKIAVIGPECTGKSDLSQFLAEHFNTVWVPEFAREYIDKLGRPYEKHDLVTIAEGQIDLEESLIKQANKILICDTNLYVIKVWSDFKYQTVDEEIMNHIRTRHYDLYLLTYIDIPWQEDPQREHPQQREALYEIYKNEMLYQSVPFIEVKGSREQRRELAITSIKKTFNLS